MIKWFREIQPADFIEVGGKGSRLAQLYNAGAKVPDGFVLTSNAYAAYVDENDLAAAINAILARDLPPQQTSAHAKALFRSDLVSDDLKTALHDAFRHLGADRVAVRSSSTAEDLPGQSFAGQYSSYLNVTDANLIESVVRCWQSLWNEQAIAYRRKYDVLPGFSHAVVVQQMIEAEAAGVVFTANPVTGHRQQVVINAAFGLGEAIVSGQVHPDQFTVDKRSGEILIREIAAKAVQCRYAETGVETIPLAETQQRTPSLNNAQIKRVVDAARTIEDQFAAPQDIEFAFDAQGNCYILQARDITSLLPIDKLDHDGKLRAYLCTSAVMLGMKEPFTPLGFEIMGFMFPTIINTMTVQKRPLDASFVKHAAGRIFVDMTYMMANTFVARQFANAFSGNDLPMAGVMKQLLDQHGKEFRSQGIRFKIPWGMLRYVFGVMGKFMAARKVAPEDRYDAVIAIGEAAYAKCAQQAQQLQTVEETLAFSRETLVAAFQMSQDQGWYCTEFTNLPKIQAKIANRYGDRFDTSLLDQIFPGCVSVEMGIRLNQLAQYFDTAQEEPSADHPQIQEFLARFGHRSAIELDFGVARWSEDPEYILNLIRSYMVDQMYARNLAEIEETRAKVEQMLEAIYQTVKADSGERRARQLRNQIIEARRAAGMREYPKFAIVRMLSLAREVMLGVGREFQALDLIDQPEDIFFLYSDEILQKQDLRRRVAVNRAAYRKEMTRTSIPRIVLNTGETYYSAQSIDPNSKVLQGMPLSPGIYEGKVRVVFDPSSAELREGEVMVTESTNPAWTPLFMTAKGLIMEYGGPVSHGGIVAREYGIPAVVGISSATTVLRDGQRVRINGESGVVEILE